MEPTNRTEQIERYLRGGMAAEERMALEHEMEQDPALRQEVADYADILKGFEALHAEAFMAQLQSYERELGASTVGEAGASSAPVWPMFRHWSAQVAAAILLLLLPISGLVYVSTQRAHQPQVLAARYFAPAPNVSANGMRAGTELVEMERARVEAMASYDQGRFGQACLDLGAFVQAHPEENVISFYLGVALLGEHRAEEALAVFQRLSPTPHPVYERDLNWYSALALLELGRLEPGLALLRTLAAEPQQPHAREARRLLQELNQD